MLGMDDGFTEKEVPLGVGGDGQKACSTDGIKRERGRKSTLPLACCDVGYFSSAMLL